VQFLVLLGPDVKIVVSRARALVPQILSEI
jgi:hypothetical protein